MRRPTRAGAAVAAAFGAERRDAASARRRRRGTTPTSGRRRWRRRAVAGSRGCWYRVAVRRAVVSGGFGALEQLGFLGRAMW